MVSESERQSQLRDKLMNGILENIEESYLNGHPTRRLPNNVHVRFKYVQGESILLNINMEGNSASTGSACASQTLMPSNVLSAMGISPEEAHGSVQFTLGRPTEEADVKYVLETIPRTIERLRAISPLTPKKEPS